ncbi:EpsG family protein [Acinetobacter lwoffii]|uniref:EpsG family protein n=1 Tax=Acinetobacter lwoffii TaxID=28090 RepID=UPI00209B63B6|nr:EpsG family protein [Acinetobacter lwoffii]MCO8061898.1 EpsG family protein [Acinetobacter lwoffii]
MKFLIKKDFLMFLIISIVVSLIVGMRGATNDTYTYYSIFKNIDNYDLKSFSGFYSETGVELGWGIYSKIISIFTQSPFILFTIYSFFIFFIIYKISEAIKIKFIYIMAFYLPTGFFLMQQFMQIRQALAVPLVIYGAILFMDNSKKKGIIFFILAIMFHQISISFIFFFFIYFLMNKRFKFNYSRNRFLFLNILTLFIGFFVARVVLFPVANNFFDRLVAYSDTEYAESVGFFSLANIKFYMEFLLILFLTTPKALANKYYVFFVLCFTVGLTLRLAFFDFAILSGRLSNAFLFVEIFLIPMLLLFRFKIFYFYIYTLLYFILLLYITWFYQASIYLKDAYFIPLY